MCIDSILRNTPLDTILDSTRPQSMISSYPVADYNHLHLLLQSEDLEQPWLLDILDHGGEPHQVTTIIELLAADN